MTNYNYLTEMTADVIAAIHDNDLISRYMSDNDIAEGEDIDRDDLANYINDFCWTDDSVTGNASGSYWFNTYKAEEAICHNLDLVAEVADEFGIDEKRRYDPEYLDVCIRCYVLGQAINEALDELGF
jgi:hypothetical protein